MIEILADGGIERFDDLHIDEIDPEWKSKARWTDGAKTALAIAMEVGAAHRFPVTVAAAFSLRSDVAAIGANFNSETDLLPRLDNSPPSLYLFPRGREPWWRDAGYRRLDDASSEPHQPSVVWWYTEFIQGDSDDLC